MASMDVARRENALNRREKAADVSVTSAARE